MKCKVLELVSSLDDGGAETLVRTYAELIDKEKFEVAIVCIQNLKSSANYKIAESNNLKIISVFNHYNFLSRVESKVLGEWLIPRRLKQIINANKPDVIHVHLSLLHYLKPISKELQGIRLFYTCHNEPRCFFFSGSKELDAATFLTQNNQLRLIALHNAMKEELNSLFHVTNTTVIRNGIDMDRFRYPKLKRSEVRKSLHIPEEAFVVGHIGRFAEQKNHVFLLKVFDQLHSQNEKAFLMLIGNGILEDTIRKQIKQLNLENKVLILSHRSDIPELLSAMDVFVFPSLFEGLSVTMVEAQAAGVRCVVSNRINPETILSENTIPVDLDESISKWCQIICDSGVKNPVHGDLLQYDMRSEMRHLEELYLGVETARISERDPKLRGNLTENS